MDIFSIFGKPEPLQKAETEMPIDKLLVDAKNLSNKHDVTVADVLLAELIINWREVNVKSTTN